MNEYVKLIVELLTMLAALIPLVYKLVEYVQKSIKEKNWTNLIQLVYQYVVIAEKKFSSGADKKEWVIAMIKGSADTINYDFDEESLSKLIDDVIAVTKKVNTETEVVSEVLENGEDK